MKFLCDRCKTRYSIGDDRVRGKILKIRCKNCANVITVREGMSDEGVVDDAGARRGRPTTGAPNASYTMTDPAAAGPLGAAFANQMTKPPAALEEEWYVSIDGDQSGPYSLSDAQKWVRSKPWDADLHCWSEGFDDWLAVDKVSHFRNLRKKPPAPQTPPPSPRVSGGGLRAQAQAQGVEEEPKPLFAATMASLEKGNEPKPALPSIGAASPAKSAGSAGAVKTNGSLKSGPAVVPTIPVFAKPQPSAKGTASVPAAAKDAKRGGPAAGQTPGAAALSAAFDASDDHDPMDSPTAIGAPPFDGTAPPFGGAAGRGHAPAVDGTAPPFGGAAGRGHAPAVEPISTPPVKQTVKEALEDDEHLDIGEVSRVVKLADLMAPRKDSRTPLRQTATVQRISYRDVPPAMAPDGSGIPNEDLAPGASVIAQAVVSRSHRRGTIMLLSFAAVLLLGVAGAVIMLVTSSGGDDLPLGLGHSNTIDTSRPEDYLPGHRASTTALGSGTTGPGPIRIVRTCPPYCNHAVTTNKGSDLPEVTDPNLKRLEASEIEDMAAKQGDGTRRCYMRAQKGALGFEIGDLKKIAVTLSVDKEGVVNDVQLSEHAADALGKCLVARIKAWKFRVSPGGTYRFSLAFSSG